MITLDVAILLRTSLTVLVHDSVMLIQRSYPRVERTFKLYSQISNKQIFVAVDRTTNLNQESNKIINAHKKIFLAPGGNNLFGLYWG